MRPVASPDLSAECCVASMEAFVRFSVESVLLA